MPASTHLIGAYGLHWKRNAIEWHPGSGRTWQMLGRVGSKGPGLRICDFRAAAGVYVLERNGRPTYAGLARSSEGLGARLLRHTDDSTKRWTAFSWFSFDDVLFDEPRKTYKPYPRGWAHLDFRPEIGRTEMNEIVGELEALVVNLIYDRHIVTNIQRPQFAQAREWTQVVRSNFRSPGICHRVADDWFAKPEWLG